MSESDPVAALPDPERVDFGHVVYPPGSALGPRYQATVQLVLMVRGSARVKVDDAAFHLPAGQVACLRPGHHEHFQFDREVETEHTWVHLRYDAVPGPLVHRLDALPRQVATPDPLSAMIEVGIAMYRRVDGNRSAAARKLASACLALFIAEITPPGHDGSRAAQPEPLQRALRFVEHRFDRPLGNADLAAAAGVTRAHLIRLFRRHLHTTPMRHLWAHRVQRGVDLLVGTGLPVSEIAYRVGFASPHHFARLVKSHTRHTPRQIRQAGWHPT